MAAEGVGLHAGVELTMGRGSGGAPAPAGLGLVVEAGARRPRISFAAAAMASPGVSGGITVVPGAATSDRYTLR